MIAKINKHILFYLVRYKFLSLIFCNYVNYNYIFHYFVFITILMHKDIDVSIHELIQTVDDILFGEYNHRSDVMAGGNGDLILTLLQGSG